MKKNILLFIMPSLFFMTLDAHIHEGCAESDCCSREANFYAKILSGANFLQKTSIDENKFAYRSGYIFAGSLGYHLCDGLHVEAEYAFRGNTIEKIHFFNEGLSKEGHCRTSSYMANLLWDLPISLGRCAFWIVKPFIGAGIGCDYHRIDSSNSRILFNQKWKQFSWQLMGGFAYPIGCNTEISLEYKFHQGGCHFYNHSLGVGIAYKFGS